MNYKEKFLLEKTINEWHSTSSIRSYGSLFFHIENSKILDLENISETFNLNNVLEFFQKYSEKWTPATYNFYVKKIRVFIKFLHREGVIRNFWYKIKFKKVDKKLPWFIENDMLESIYNFLENEEEKRIFKIFLYTWMRRFELSLISDKNINFFRKEIRVFWKGRKERIVPIHEEIFDDLKNIKFPIALSKIDKLREKIQKYFPNFKLHNLRHTFATSLIRAGGNIYTLSQIMWHWKIDTTTVYLSLDTSSAKKEISKIKFDFLKK